MMIDAEVRYLKPEWKERDERAFIYSRETRHANTDLHTVHITDARPLVASGDVTLETNGMTLREHSVGGVEDYADEGAIRADYDQTILPLLQEVTGAEAVFMMAHQVRTENRDIFLNAYARFVHCDYPLTPSPGREKKLLERYQSPLAEEIDKRDYAWFNIWEAFDRPAEKSQLALIDATSVEDDDFAEYHFAKRREDGYAALPTRNPNHRFYYFSNMQPGEAAIFTQYDSRPGRPMVCPHTAFYHPGFPDDHPGRRSVEYRALAVF